MRCFRFVVLGVALLATSHVSAQEGSGDGAPEGDGVTPDAMPTAGSEPSSVVVFEESARERFDWEGERNLFGIRILGAQVIEAEFVVHPAQTVEGFGDVVTIQVHGQTSGFFDAIYHVENTAVIYVNLDTGLPIYTNYDYNESEYVSNNTLEWQHDDYRVNVHRVDPETDEWETATIPAMAYDEATMFMELRSRDIGVGDQMLFYQYDGLNLWRFVGTVLEHDALWIDAFQEEIDVAVIEFAGQEMQSESVSPWGGDDEPGLPPVMRGVGDPEVIATGYIGVEERTFAGADISTPIGNLTIRLNEHRRATGGN